MTREAAPNVVRNAATIELITAGDAALVTVNGAVDERFVGFGDLGPLAVLVLDVGGLTRMTSFGVRQWLTAIQQLPKTLAHLYVVGCPTFFVDQLNMVAHLIGPGRVVTAAAPYLCEQCSNEATEIIDVLAERNTLLKAAPPRSCSKCGGRMELDESPEAYFAFCREVAAVELAPAAAELLAAQGVYQSAEAGGMQVAKQVRGGQTHLEISGPIGTAFRAAPLLSGVSGEVFIHLEGVERFYQGAEREWRKLIQTLAGLVATVHVDDVPSTLLAAAADSLVADNVVVDSIRAPYQCGGCGRIDQVRCSAKDPLAERTCATCGAVARCRLSPQVVATLRAANARAVVPVPAPAATSGLDAYEIIRKLSTSATADLFLATRTDTAETVVLKRFHTGAATPSLPLLERAARLNHPNIARIRDVIATGTAVALALDYVHGTDLEALQQQLMARGQGIPVADVAHIVRELALALVHVRAALPDAVELPPLGEIVVSATGDVKLLGVGTAPPDRSAAPRSDADALLEVFDQLAQGQQPPIAWPQRVQDIADELGRALHDPALGLASGPAQLAGLVALATTHAPLVTDGANVKIAAGAPERARRSTKSTLQPPLRRPAAPSTPPPVRRAVAPTVQRAAGRDSLINLVIVIAIIAVVIVGGYFILSNA